MARKFSSALRVCVLSALLLALAVLAVRGFVGDVFLVESSSMEPALHAQNERVFVRFDRGHRPDRFDLVVFTPAQGGAAVVKRAAGLPGESVAVSGGDLWIEGKRLAVDVPRPEAIATFDAGELAPTEAFAVVNSTLERVGDVWQLDASARRADCNLLRPATDDYFDGSGQRVIGTHEVNDLRVEVSVRAQGSGRLTLRVTEEGDAFELELDYRDGAVLEARLVHRAGNAAAEIVGRIGGDALGARSSRAAPLRLELENIDNHVIAGVDGARLVHHYADNVPIAGVVDAPRRHLQPRVMISASDLKLDFRQLRLARDLYYTADGPLGTGSPVALGPDELFCLGDNSAQSRDSRVIGAVRLEEVAGRPVAVVWPPPALRGLGGLRRLVPGP